MAEENPEKPQLGDHLMKAVRPFIASNNPPYLQMMMVGSHIMSGMEKKGKKKNKAEQETI